jgi:hypothetical protein
LEGDWTAIESAFFTEWSEANHVLRPTSLPGDWVRFRAADWGSASPFCCLWFAVAQDRWQHPDGASVPRGALDTYREFYGSRDSSVGGLPGLKIIGTEFAKRLADLEKNDPKLSIGVLDPSAFNVTSGPSIGEEINNVLIANRLTPFHQADNARVPTQGSKDRRGAMSGWDQLRMRLVGDGERPMIYFFSSCRALIRTLPVLQHDPMRAEDLDTSSEDHAVDAARYGVMARPWFRAPEERVKKVVDAYSEVDPYVEYERSSSILTL